jgi:uncharacterized tellurite resistance protein B-like protein
MITLFEKLVVRLSSPKDESTLSQEELNLATVALLFEVAAIDQRLEASEIKALEALLIDQYQIDLAEIQPLIDSAKQASASSSSLYEFTQLINKGCNHTEKKQLVEGLWKIAYADGNLDKYEEHIIRRIADLIHVSHHDFIHTKLSVRDSQGS